MESADVIIIGAGLAGCSVGYWLSPHQKVCLVEQGVQPGAEAASQNAGMVRRLGEDPFERALALRTVQWLEQLPEGWQAEDPSRVVGAVLGLVHDPHHLTDAVAHLRARGVRVEALDRLDEVAPAAVGARLQRAWYLPDERVADAHTLVQGFVAGVKSGGGTLALGERVLELVVDGSKVIGVRTTAGERHAGRVVLAAGAWTAALAAQAGLRRPLVPLRRSLLQSEAHSVSHPDHPWLWLDDVGVYVRPEAGGWLSSGCDEAVDPPEPGPGSRGPVEPLNAALAQYKVETHLPALGELRWRAGWTGLRTFAPDRRPVLGADPELEGLWWAAGLGGFGVTCSMAVGEAMAGWMLGDEVPWLHAASVGPARWFPGRWPIRPDGSLLGSTLIDRSR